MVQLIVFLLVVVALVILVLQNLSPVLSLVVLGQPTVALPLSLWLLGAIAIGTLCTVVIYQLVPQRRTYRPMGKRLSDPVSEPAATNRFVDAPPSDRFQSPTASQTGPQAQNPYDSDWENFRAPEQWDDWGQQQSSGRFTDSPRPASGDAVDDTVRDIESGWGDDDYAQSGRYATRRQEGWQGREDERTRSYEEGWIYGDDAQSEPPIAEEPAPPPEESEDVYDANYRVIIPPYEGKETKDSGHS